MNKEIQHLIAILVFTKTRRRWYHFREPYIAFWQIQAHLKAAGYDVTIEEISNAVSASIFVTCYNKTDTFGYVTGCAYLHRDFEKLCQKLLTGLT